MEKTRLQGVGLHPAIPAKELKPGMTAVWNFGYTSRIKAVEPTKTGKMVTVTSESNGKEYQRRFGADRLVAVEMEPFDGGEVIKMQAGYSACDYTDYQRKYIEDVGGRIDEKTGMITISRKNLLNRAYASKSIIDSSIYTWMLPGSCLIFEGRHFTITD